MFRLATLGYDSGTGRTTMTMMIENRQSAALTNGKSNSQMSKGDDENDVNDSEHNDWPQIVDEAVDRLVHELSDRDKETVRSTPKDELIKFHFGWGMGIRNGFGLWGGNEALLKSCAEARYGPGADATLMHPDDASGVVIEAVWRRLQAEK